MLGRGVSSRLSLQNSIKHATIVSDYLKNYFERKFKVYSEYLSDDSFTSPINFKLIDEILDNFQGKKLAKSLAEFESGQVLTAKIIGIKDFGTFVNIDKSGQRGLIKKHNLTNKHDRENHRIGDTISVKIIKFNTEHRTYDLKIVTENISE